MTDPTEDIPADSPLGECNGDLKLGALDPGVSGAVGIGAVVESAEQLDRPLKGMCDTSTHRVAVKVTWLRQHIVSARGGGHRHIGRRELADASLSACHGEVCRQVDPRPVWRSTQRLRRHFQGKPLASLLTTNSGRGPGTAHFAATSTPDELTPPPPISTMRWRIAAPETVRCVDGKR